MKDRKINKWLQIIILGLGAGAVYQFPYLRYAFFVQLQNALGLNNLEFGMTLSVYGVVAMICYFPGGWLADRVSPKKLIVFSLISTGLSGFYFATFPSYTMNLILNGVWGVTTILTYWAALLKITRSLGEENEQGRLYGFLEGSRGIFSALAAFVMLAVLTSFSSATVGLAAIIRIMSVLEVCVGVLTIFLINDPKQKKDEAPRLKDVGRLLKRKEVWLIAGVIFTA
jgi:predicted MFS family arabinose efflux permease